MERCEQFETEEEVLMNRIRIRKYLRELLMNSRRIDEILAMNTVKSAEEAEQQLLESSKQTIKE
jgi:hypothetical protein